MGNYTGILGIIVLLGIAFLLSNNKTLINKNIIFWGLGLQISFAIIILKTSFGKALFFYFNILIVKLISFADAGSDFLFTSFIPIFLDLRERRLADAWQYIHDLVL